MLKISSSRRARASFAGLSLLALGLAGCSGGGSSNRNRGQNNSLPDVGVAVLTENNVLSVVNARRPGVRQAVNVTGLRPGEQLIGIDFRYRNTLAGDDLLYGLGSLDNTYQLYRFQNIDNSSASATAVGTPLSFATPLGRVAFDFNPMADRIRLIDTASGRNFRLNPNDGALVATDTTVAYAPSDPNTGTPPQIANVAYTNNDANDQTGTVIYGIDLTRGALVSVGDDGNQQGPDTGASPNGGQLFTIGNLSTPPVAGGVGFDITPNVGGTTSNRALVAFAPNVGGNIRLYELSLTSGQLSGGSPINLPASANIVAIAVGGTGPSTPNAG